MNETIDSNHDLLEERRYYAKKAKYLESRAREHYLEKVSDIKEKVKHFTEDASVTAKEVIDSVGTYVKENPQKASLIGFSVGLGLGIALGMMFRKR